MAFFCRQNLLHTDGHLIGYRYHDANYIAFFKSVAEPLNIVDAQRVCTSAFTGAVTAIDGLMTYADGSGGSTLTALFATYFEFDQSIFEIVISAYLVSFVSGHILGRVVSGLRKAG